MDLINSIQDNHENQHKLDELCAKHGMKSWPIASKTGQWRLLCLAMLEITEIESRKPGRPSYPEELIRKIGGHAYAIGVFKAVMPDGTRKFLNKHKAFEQLARDHNLISKISDGGRISDPYQVIRGMRDKYKKLKAADTEKMSKDQHD